MAISDFSETDGQQQQESLKQHWLVLNDVPADRLEDELNRLHRAGYYVYRLKQRNSDKGLEYVAWDIVAQVRIFSQVPGIRKQLERIGNLLANNKEKLAKKIAESVTT